MAEFTGDERVRLVQRQRERITKLEQILEVEKSAHAETRDMEASLRRIVDEIATLFPIVPDQIDALPLCVKSHFGDRMRFFTELTDATTEIERLAGELKTANRELEVRRAPWDCGDCCSPKHDDHVCDDCKNYSAFEKEPETDSDGYSLAVDLAGGYKNKCAHKKVYSGEFGASNARQWNWICSLCGDCGTDRFEPPPEINLVQYAALYEAKEGPSQWLRDLIHNRT